MPADSRRDSGADGAPRLLTGLRGEVGISILGASGAFSSWVSPFFMEAAVLGLDSVRFPSQEIWGRAMGIGIRENSSLHSPIPSEFPWCFSHPRKTQENGV